MKLLLESTDTAMLMARSALLEARGIPIHLDAVAHVGVVPQHLYIVLDEQLGDALALLEDENHEVSNPVFPEELEALTPELRQQAQASGNMAMNRIVVGGLALVFVIMLILWLS
jgi:hypothetical protein